MPWLRAFSAELVGPVPDSVVADVVGERQGPALLEHHVQQRLHRAVVPVEQVVQRGQVCLHAEPGAHFLDPPGGGPAGGDQAVQVGAVPVRDPDLVEDDAQRVLVQRARLVERERRDDHALLVDGARVSGHGAGGLAADVGHVAEHGRPADQPALEVDRQHHEPVVGVADRGAAGVRVGGEEHITFTDLTVEAVEEIGDGQAELADDHLAAGVGDQRELVVLLADAGGQCGAEQHLVHLVPGVARRGRTAAS